MKSFARSVLTCLLACVALSGLQAELPVNSSRNWTNVALRALYGTQLVIGAIVRSSPIGIQMANSFDSQIDDDHAAGKRHKHGAGSGDAIVTGESYKLDAGRIDKRVRGFSRRQRRNIRGRKRRPGADRE